MCCSEAASAPAPGEKYRLAFSYSVQGDLRFISHHDTLRMFRLALNRAGMPVRFSEGFNPHPRVTIPLPRPVGVASDVELLVVEFTEPIAPDEALARLARRLPVGARIRGVRRIESGEHIRPTAVRYQLQADDRTPEELRARIRQVLESDVVEVERLNAKTGSRRVVDVRQFLSDMRLDGSTVEFTLLISDSGTAKPSEIAALLGYDADSINHRILRMDVEWQ